MMVPKRAGTAVGRQMILEKQIEKPTGITTRVHINCRRPITPFMPIEMLCKCFEKPISKLFWIIKDVEQDARQACSRPSGNTDTYRCGVEAPPPL